MTQQKRKQKNLKEIHPPRTSQHLRAEPLGYFFAIHWSSKNLFVVIFSQDRMNI